MDPKALWKLGYGMYIIGARKGDKINAQVANTVFQITSDPPTVAVSINKKNLTWEYIHASQAFSATVLCQDAPLSFIGQFGFKSGRDVNKFESINYKAGVTGSPIVLDNAVSYLEVKVKQEMDVGTHTIFIGDVVAAEVIAEKACLTYEYYQQVKRGTTPKTAPTFSEGKKDSAGQVKSAVSGTEGSKPKPESQARAAAPVGAAPSKDKAEADTGSSSQAPTSQPREQRNPPAKGAPTEAPPDQAPAGQKPAEQKMAKYKCSVCGYIYDPAKGDPDGGIKPGTPFESIPDDWKCPVCGAAKSEFQKLEE